MGKTDSGLWHGEYLRQFQAIKAALHSLRLQSADRIAKGPKTKAVKEMAFKFALVEEAFQALNRPEPRCENEDHIPGPGRREFLSDLEHGEVRT